MRTNAEGERELVMARWGMPGPPQYRGAPVTNIRTSIARVGPFEREESLHRAGHVVLRIRRRNAAQDPDMVGLEQRKATVRLRRPPDALARGERPEERAH